MAGVVALAVAAIGVVSVLTGAKVTNGDSGPTSALVGKHVGTFSLKGLNGGVERAPWTEHRASVLIFFASWCGPCKGEMPKVARYLREHDPSPVEVLGVDANDTLAGGRAMVKLDDVTFPVAFDADGSVTNSDFGFATLPESVFISAKGVVTKVYFGAIPEKQLAEGIAKLKSA